MVGKRSWASTNGQKGGEDTVRKELNGRGLEDGPKPRVKPAFLRFQDASNKALEDDRRAKIKDKLLEEVAREQFERYRKSDEEIKSFKNKKLRKFYEGQNYCPQ